MPNLKEAAELAAKMLAETLEKTDKLVIEAQRNEKRAIDMVVDLRRELMDARKDSARLDHLERLGLTTHPAGGRNKKDYGIHSWSDNETGEIRWTARYISSEFKTLRAATDASMAMEESNGIQE